MESAAGRALLTAAGPFLTRGEDAVLDEASLGHFWLSEAFNLTSSLLWGQRDLVEVLLCTPGVHLHPSSCLHLRRPTECQALKKLSAYYVTEPTGGEAEAQKILEACPGSTAW